MNEEITTKEPILCKKGLHIITGDNLMKGYRGENMCRECRKAYMREYMTNYWKNHPNLRYGEAYRKARARKHGDSQ